MDWPSESNAFSISTFDCSERFSGVVTAASSSARVDSVGGIAIALWGVASSGGVTSEAAAHSGTCRQSSGDFRTGFLGGIRRFQIGIDYRFRFGWTLVPTAFGSPELDCDDSDQGRKNMNTTVITTATPISPPIQTADRPFVHFDRFAFQKIRELNLLRILVGRLLDDIDIWQILSRI